jgi:two-component system, OmpR family, response regulator
MDAHPLSLLVVEDDGGLRTLARVVLELEHWQVREAATLEQAEAALDRAAPDVVLLDLNLQGESTLPLFDRLRDAGIPFVAVSGTSEIGDVGDRADATLAKPFDPRQLVAVVRDLARVEP